MDIGDVRQNRGYHVLVAAGLISWGLVHLMLAWIALQVAFGSKADASNTGALKQLAQQPLGVGLLWAMAVGLFTLTIWQVLEATIGRTEAGRDGSTKRRLASAGRALVYLLVGILTISVAIGSSSKSGKSEETLSARLMSVPFGRILVAAVGIAVIAVGVSQIVKGVKKNFTEDLSSGVTAWTLKLGTVGYCAKGVSLSIIGALFGWAAITYDAKKAGGMDAALSTIRDQPAGPILLAVMSVGIACFAVFCFVWARNPRY